MSQRHLTLAEFPPVSTAEWEAVIRKDLKGAAPKTKLFYRAEDLPGWSIWIPHPASFPTRAARATTTTGASAKWCTTPPRRVRRSTRARRRSASCSVTRTSRSVWMRSRACAVHFDSRRRAPRKCSGSSWRQPRPRKRRTAPSTTSLLPDFDHAAKLVPRSCAMPQFRPITIRAHRFSEAGATSSRSSASRWPKASRSSRNSPIAALTADRCRAMRWHFRSPGSNYFLEIAKLRAARMLWARAVASFGPADPAPRKMTIYARTSHLTQDHLRSVRQSAARHHRSHGRGDRRRDAHRSRAFDAPIATRTSQRGAWRAIRN